MTVVTPRGRAVRTAALFISTVLASGLVMPASAQIVVNLPPTLPAGTAPIRSPIDENSVNLGNGRLETAVVDLSIGSGGAGGLAHMRYWSHVSWRDGFLISITRLGTILSNALSGKYQSVVSFGVNSYTFSDQAKDPVYGIPMFGSPYVSEQGNGVTLTESGNILTFTASDGTKILFDKNLAATYSNILSAQYGPPNFAMATEIISPNGERTKISYKQLTLVDPYLGDIKLSRIQSVTNNSGYQLKYEYGAQNWTRPIKITGINNALEYCDPTADTCPLTQSWPSVSYTRTEGTVTPPVNAIETSTDNLGRSTRYTFEPNQITNKMLAIKRPSSSTDNVTITYDTATTSVSSVTKIGVGTWTYATATGTGTLTVTRTDPLGHTRVTTTDATQLVTKSDKDELNRTTTTTLDTLGRVTSIAAPEGNATQYVYDARGNITTTTIVPKAGSGVANIVLSSGYDTICANSLTCNKPIWTRDAKLNQTDYGYDAATGLTTSVTEPAPASGGIRPQTRLGYTALQAYYKNSAGSIVASGLPITKLTSTSSCQTTASCAGSADEVKSTLSYGPQVAGVANNLLPAAVTSGSGDGILASTNALTYDSTGNRTAIDGPLPGTADTTVMRYDAVRQNIGIIGADPDGAGPRKNTATRNSYNLDGQVTVSELGTVNSQSDADWAAFSTLQQSTSTYDAPGRKTKDVLTASGITYGITQYSYDAEGRIDCSTVRLNDAIWTSLPASACTAQTAGAAGPDRITKQIYDAADQVTQVQTAVGTTAQVNESRTYSLNGEVSSITDGINNKTTFEYDGVDRLSKTRYPSATLGANASSTTDFEQLTYDANGNVTQRRLRDGVLHNFTYDALNRQTLKDTPNAAYYDLDITTTYDLLGRPLTISNTNADVVTLAYDALGRAISQGSTYGTKSMTYDAAGRRTSMTYPGGVLTINTDYDVTGNVTAIRENGATSGVGVLGTYAYDNLGRRTSLTRGNGTVTSFAFDPVSRLLSLTQNLAGTANDITLGFTYNPASQIATATRSTDVYAWGSHYNVNRPYGTNGLNQLTTAGATALGYDGRGNLISSGSSTYSYTSSNHLNGTGSGIYIRHDPVGRLLLTYTSPTQQTYFDYDGTDLIAEYNANSALLRRYVHGPGTDEPLVWYEGTGLTDRRFLHADERGSVIVISDGTGAATNINKYDEYGIPAATNVGRFQYTGQTWLPELGMYYYKARIYSPTLGRFMQTDPIGYGDGVNWYDYVGGDPVNGMDPSGKSCADVGTYSNSYCDPSNPGDDGPVIKVTGKLDWNRGPNIFERIWAVISGKCDAECNVQKIVDWHVKNAVAPVADSGGFHVCELGNSWIKTADQAGDFSIKSTLIGGGIAVAGAGLENPVVAGGGVALMDVGAAAGLAAGAAQFIGGIEQGLGGKGFKNAVAAVASLGAGVVTSKVIKATTPSGGSKRLQSKRNRNNRTAGNVIGGLQSVSEFLSPTTVNCGNP